MGLEMFKKEIGPQALATEILPGKILFQLFSFYGTFRKVDPPNFSYVSE